MNWLSKSLTDFKKKMQEYSPMIFVEEEYGWTFQNGHSVAAYTSLLNSHQKNAYTRVSQ